MRKETFVSAAALAEIYAALGDKDHAFFWLNTAIDERDMVVPFFKTIPFGDLRTDPRFQQVLKKVGMMAPVASP